MNDINISKFNNYFSKAELDTIDKLDSPGKIQTFLDDTLYSSENANRNPIRVFREHIAHCLDGAIFAAALLRRLGWAPLILDLLPEPGTDDDHVLAIYKDGNRFGAIAKSNFTGLRLREPIFRTPRELVLSYFEDFFNIHGQKTLRAYSRIIDLRAHDHLNWLWADSGIDEIEKHLYTLKKIPLFEPKIADNFNLADPISYKAGMLVVNPAGLYNPDREQHL